MDHPSFYKIYSAAAGLQSTHTMAVIRADDDEILDAVVDAQAAHLAHAILIGDTAKIKHILEKHGANWREYTLLHEENDTRAAQLGVQLIRQGQADILVKGNLSTATLMRQVAAPNYGIQIGTLLSHMMFYEPAGHKLLCVTDGGLHTFPDLEKKKQILCNAAQAFQKIKHDHIAAACICGAETAHPRISSTQDAQHLCQMNSEWRKNYNMSVFGPVGLDLAISKEAAAHKHYTAAYAGEADILLVPNYEVGNAIGNAMRIFANAKTAGIVCGAQVPIALVSRADPPESQFNSIALCCILAQTEQSQTEDYV